MLKLFIFLALSLTLSFNLWAKSYSFLETNPESERKDVSVITSDKGWQTEVIVQFHVSGMETEDKKIAPVDKDFQKLKFSELSLTSSEGQPELPYHTILVYSEPDDLVISVKPRDGLSYRDIVPYPSPRYPSRCGKTRELIEDIDWDSYQEHAEKFYEVEKIGVFRGMPVSRVSFYPVQYRGLEKGLQVYPRMTATVWNKDDGRIEIIDQGTLFEKDVLLNNRYLILTPSRFVDTLKTFIDWKKKLGFEVVVYTLEQVGTTFTKINEFLHNTYNNANTRYTFALLVGEETIIPTDYKSTTGASKTPSDLTYFTMGGAGDYIPDVYAGRMVVSTAEDILRQTAKIINYEKGVYQRAGGFTRGIGIASREGSNPSDVDYVKSVNDYFTKTYGTTFANYFQANADATPANVNKSLSEGVMWLTYLGHGSGTAWASLNSGYYTTTNVKSIIPGGVQPVVIDVSCLNGRFIKGKLGERMMNEVNQNFPVGSTAFYGGSVSISWHPPAIMARGIAKSVAEERPRHLSQALLSGQMYLVKNYSDLNSVIDNFEWYHLFGDPSMIIRTTTPEPLNVAIDGNKMMLSNDAGLSVSGIEVVFTKGAIIVRGTSNDQGIVEMPDVGTGFTYAILNANFSYIEGTL